MENISLSFPSMIVWLSSVLHLAASEYIFVPSPTNLKIFPGHKTLYHPIERACDEGLTHAGDKCLYVSNFQLDWLDAYRYCFQRGGTLLDILSGSEYTDLIQGLTRHDSESFWTSANLYQDSWKWPDGSVVHSAYWALSVSSGNPIHEPPSDPKKPCSYLDSNRFFFMDADSCNTKRNFICQKEAKKVQFPLGNLYPFGHETDVEQTTEENKPQLICDKGYQMAEFTDSAGVAYQTCYNFEEIISNFATAEYYCQNDGASMATPRTEDEKNYLAGMLATESRGLWLPIQFSGNAEIPAFSEKENGNPFETHPWKLSTYSDNPEEEFCYYASIASKDDVTLEQCSCFSQRRFVCQKPAMLQTTVFSAPTTESVAEVAVE